MYRGGDRVATSPLVCFADPVPDWAGPAGSGYPSPHKSPDFHKVKKAVLQILNLNPEAYQRRLREIKFQTDYQPQLIA